MKELERSVVLEPLEKEPERRYPQQPIDCRRCIAPGMCCKAFPLSFTVPEAYTPKQVQAFLDTKRDDQGRRYPFKVLRRHKKPEYGEQQWMFTCPQLKPSGRCGIYKDRPYTCRDYEAGSDVMCVHYRAPNGKPYIPMKDE